MADRRRTMLARLLPSLLVLALAGAALPAANADHGAVHNEKCERGPAFATIDNVSANGVTLQTQAGGQVFELPRGLVALAVSTTGVLDVQVRHECVLTYTFSWTVQGQLGTSSGSATVNPNCVGGTDVHQIPIGNDVASVHMELVWTGCDGTAGKDVRDVKVVDPKLSL